MIEAKKEVDIARESTSCGKVFRSKDGRQETRYCPKHQEQVQKQRNLGHDGSETTVQMGDPDPTGPRMGDRHETSCECDQRNGADIFEHRNRDAKPEKSGDGCKP